MPTTSINGLAKKAITDALVTAGFTVYPNILEWHTGVRTKSKEYIELGRGFVRQNDEITIDCIQGEFEIEMKYYKPSAWNEADNTAGYDFEDACVLVEKAISQVKTSGMFTRFNMARDIPTTPHNRGQECRWSLSCTVASSQNRV